LGQFTVKLSKLIDEFGLVPVTMPEEPEHILISSCEVNRPGLQMLGFFEYFDESRVQIIGLVEHTYFKNMPPEQREKGADDYMAKKPVAVIFTRDMDPMPEFVEAAKKYGVALLKTAEQTSQFMAALIALLNVELAPRITRHGVLVEVSGEGILLLGDSGVGKSETAVELIKRGHRLIADDAVEIRRVSNKTLVGSSPENIRHFIELRGIGVVNVRRLFGMGAVKATEKIDLVIEMEPWDSEKVYERLGVGNETIDILGIEIPCLTIPIKPGRNLAIIIETAAMNNRDKKFGYNPTLELMKQLGMDTEDFEESFKKKDL